MCKLKIAGISNDSIVDGRGLRFTVFVQGCPHGCLGCHNPQTHDYDGGYDIEISELFEKISSNPLLDGVTFSGGEPMSQPAPLIKLAEMCRNINLNIWIYSGYTFEEICANDDMKALLGMADVLVDGRFENEKRSLNLKFRGSSNQRIIDVKKSLKASKAIIADE